MLGKITLALAAAGCAFAVQADTLQKIRSSGAVTMGVREASGALSCSLGDKYVGFRVELCQRALAQSIAQLAGLDHLGHHERAIAAQARTGARCRLPGDLRQRPHREHADPVRGPRGCVRDGCAGPGRQHRPEPQPR